jgi:hypothetical protein
MVGGASMLIKNQKQILQVFLAGAKKNLDLKSSDWRYFLVILFFVSFSALNVITAPKTAVGSKTGSKPAEQDYKQMEVYWLGFLSDNPTYLDGWIELSKIYFAKGDLVSSKAALREARQIDPNSEKLYYTENLLGFN